MPQFKPGQRVYVIDEGLSRLNQIMGISDHEATNNKGTVATDEEGQDIYADSGMVLINFDDGGGAPYPVEDVRPLL